MAAVLRVDWRHREHRDRCRSNSAVLENADAFVNRHQLGGTVALYSASLGVSSGIEPPTLGG
jgi:hypothetical protein